MGIVFMDTAGTTVHESEDNDPQLNVGDTVMFENVGHDVAVILYDIQLDVKTYMLED